MTKAKTTFRFGDLKKLVRKIDADIKADIKGEKNPIIRNMKEMQRDVHDIYQKCLHFELMYGIELNVLIPALKKKKN